MDQTEWPVEDASSYERQAQDHVFQGRIDAAADCYEKALRIRLKSGDKPSQLVHAAEVLARASNHACKDASVPKAGERQLQRTLGLLYDVRDSGCAGAVLLSCINLTLANLAALHMRAGRHTTALRYLREAEALGAPPAEAAATQLSLCALLSQLGRHKEAEHHAAEAVALGEADILELSSRSEGVTPALLREKASALAVAYNNRAVQREYLGGEDCLALYEKAVVLAEGHMEKDNPLLIRLQESHRNALQISVGRKSNRRPSSAVNFRSAPRRDAEVRRPVSAVESRRASSCSRAKPNLDQELLRLLRPEEQHLLAARHKAREGADDLSPEVPLSAPTLPRHMRVALEQQREGARCHQAVGTWVEDGQAFGRDCAGTSGTSGTDMSSRRRETGDPRLQHALHFAGCEAARRIQQAYRKHLWFLKVRREARQARELQKAGEAQRATPETPLCSVDIQPRPRLQSHEAPRDSLPQTVSNFRAGLAETHSEKIERDEILNNFLQHSAPSDALPRPRAMELTNGLPQRTLPSLGSNPGRALGSCTKVAEMRPKEIQDKAGKTLKTFDSMMV